MISVFWTVRTAVVVTLTTLILGLVVIIAAALGVPDRDGGVFESITRLWARLVLWGAGVQVRVHGLERLYDGNGVMKGAHIFASNHVSHFDIPALVAFLPRHHFVAKAELFKIPVFGPGIRAVGAIPIERSNQKAAFGSYAVAAERIRGGRSVVVFPEGTRGTAYPIRPFKKGPFVLAIEAEAPIIPCVIHGTIEILPKKSLRVHPGSVDIHLLDPVPVTGLAYTDREALATQVHDRMVSAMHTLYPNA